LVPVLNKILL